MMFRPIISLGLGASLLAACGSDAPPAETEAEQDRAAKGEVVGGTISDDMIPLDRLRSQSPPMAEASAASHSSGAEPAAEPTEAEAPEAAEAETPEQTGAPEEGETE